MRPLREIVRDLRLTPEERLDTRAEQCLETLFDSERCSCVHLGEREEAALEAERRRWAGAEGRAQGPNAGATAFSTGRARGKGPAAAP